MQFKQPPILHNEEGKLRTVGFELEYANVGITESAEIIQELYGGTVQKENRFKQKVVDTSLGNFTVEFDLTLLTEKSYKKVFDTFDIHLEDIKLGTGTLEDEVEEVLGSLVGKVFPNEIACPPIPFTQLDQLEKLREALYRRQAEGTESFPTNAFGTHINAELPALDSGTILSYLQAFLLLYPWLLQAGKTDLARKLSPFIAPYPAEYADLILAHAYNPDLEKLIRDYNKHNPDRNRPLDMYPLFASLKNELVSQFTGLGKVKARDTFHYRLPNSSISQPDWTLAKEWNNWVVIEELANNHKAITKLSDEYLVLKQNTLIGFDNKWVKRIDEWLS